ncbi:Transcription elongation factor SPT5 [Quillaja saponaria]|uniref:Transcription elongation factor SPT5 n=1 Tax=Quillaja saponaria TaxID=32244 RepID=A0AAD7L4B1_QUISA|nr:Transcription elongation factor SPT5 [Quillaja saponaria]KAJ7951335.1 Transcription elongation factor SPT5 [Quillaja saponaria]
MDIEAEASSDDGEDDEEGGEDDFIDDAGAYLPEEDDGSRVQSRPFLPLEDQDDDEFIERYLQKINERSCEMEYDEENANVEQQALLPSIRDPKLWLIGHERMASACLMQMYIDKGAELQIRSAIALDNLRNYIYVEAYKEAPVREACRGLRYISAQKISLVPIAEMTNVLSIKSKAVNLSKDTWVRIKSGIYKGDLAQVVGVDNLSQRVTVKLIPRIGLQALANKLEGREVVKKKAFVPPPRLINFKEAGELCIGLVRKQDPFSRGYVDIIGGMMFKDGFLYKVLSMKSISFQNVKPTFNELENFGNRGDNGDVDIPSLSTLFLNRKKGHFMKGDAVIVISGEVKNLKGWVDKVDEEIVYIRTAIKGVTETLAVNESEICKHFEPGNHVKVVSGLHEGSIGMVVKVEKHVLTILSDTTKDHIHVFADDVVESFEVTCGITRLGNYVLHDLVLLDDLSFGVIIRVESEAFLVLKGVSNQQEVALVKLREIKSKIEKKFRGHDDFNNIICVNDIVQILQGPCKGKQGPVQHIYRGVLFFYDCYHLEHAGFICAKANSCQVVGGSRSYDGNVSQFLNRFPRGGPLEEGRGADRGNDRCIGNGGKHRVNGGSDLSVGTGVRYRNNRGNDCSVGTMVKVSKGPYKGYCSHIVEVKGTVVWIELESQMKIVRVAVSCDVIPDSVAVTTPFRVTPRYGILGSQTPLRPSQTPVRDFRATPSHDGMRTPMRHSAWNIYTTMNPQRDDWEDGNPGSWRITPQYQYGSPLSRSDDAPISGWASTSSNYSQAGTPRGQMKLPNHDRS